MLVGKLQRSLCEKGATNQRFHAAGVFGIFFFFPVFFSSLFLFDRFQAIGRGCLFPKECYLGNNYSSPRI